MEHEHYHIGQLAAELGRNPKTIRSYEALGILAPATRSPAGYRRYTRAERDARHFIITAKAAGLTLAELGAILALRRDGQEPCAHLRALLDGKLAAVEAQLRVLTAFRDALRTLRDAAETTDRDGAVCGIIERHAAGRAADPVVTA